MKRIIEYLPLLSVCLIYFGFCNLFYYYEEFKIDIYSYISTTDILLSFLPKIVLFTSLIYGTLLTQLFESIRKPKEVILQSEDESKKRKAKLDWWRKNIYYFVALYYLPVLLLIAILEKGFHYKSYELIDLNMLIDFIFLCLVYVAFMIHEKRDSFFKNPLLIALFLIVFIGQKIGTLRVNAAKKIKDGQSEFVKDHLSFSYKDSKISTTDSILFIGGTSTHLFLYNIKDSSSHVYPFSEISDLKIK